MAFDTRTFFTALGLALCMEGALWALFPRFMREAMAQLAAGPTALVRGAGLFALGLGLLLAWLARG